MLLAALEDGRFTDTRRRITSARQVLSPLPHDPLRLPNDVRAQDGPAQLPDDAHHPVQLGAHQPALQLPADRRDVLQARAVRIAVVHPVPVSLVRVRDLRAVLVVREPPPPAPDPVRPLQVGHDARVARQRRPDGPPQRGQLGAVHLAVSV